MKDKSYRTKPTDNWPDTDHKPTNADREHLEDIVGRGKGDPDIYGYPSEVVEDLGVANTNTGLDESPPF